MFWHVVLLKMKRVDPVFFEKFRDYELRILQSSDDVKYYHLARNEAASSKGYEFALYSLFASRAAFEEYDRSELHQSLKTYIQPFVEDLIVVDWNQEADITT